MTNLENNFFSLVKDFKNLLEDVEDNEIFSDDFQYFQNEFKKSKSSEKKEFTFNKTEKKSFKKVIEKMPTKKESDDFLLPQAKKPNFENSITKNVKDEFSKLLKDFEIVENAPSDNIAKKVANSWKYKNKAENISIFYYKENFENFKFLKNLATAITVYFNIKAKIFDVEFLENENHIDDFLKSTNLKLIIMPSYSVENFKTLKTHYLEKPNLKLKYFQNIKIFELLEISKYLENHLLKIELYNKLKEILKDID